MFGVPNDSPANAFCDNKRMCQLPSQSTVKKKHHSTAFIKIRESAQLLPY